MGGTSTAMGRWLRMSPISRTRWGALHHRLSPKSAHPIHTCSCVCVCVLRSRRVSRGAQWTTGMGMGTGMSTQMSTTTVTSTPMGIVTAKVLRLAEQKNTAASKILKTGPGI